jgi:RNA polymerase sigma-70 factor (ECF subfamily)
MSHAVLVCIQPACIQNGLRYVAHSMDRIDTLPPDIELAQLLQHCAARDSAAFRSLYDKTSPILFARLLRMLRRRSVAEEALQEVYVRIWERAGQYEAGRGRALAWMVTIARYCAIDLMRRERMTLVGDDALAEVADENTSEPGAFDKPNNFDDCIGQLPDNTRKCLTLAFVEGRSHDEIARLTTNPLGSVKSWIRRGLLSLKECLGSERQTA